MAFNQPHHLTPQQIRKLFADFDREQLLEVISIRYKNKDEIRRGTQKKASEVELFILECIEDEDQPGGDLEVIFPESSFYLVGHHDGVYWLEDSSTREVLQFT